MSSMVINSHRKKDLMVELEWDKYAPHFIVYVLKDLPRSQIKQSGPSCTTLFRNRYNTLENAKRSYRLQVKKLEEGVY